MQLSITQMSSHTHADSFAPVCQLSQSSPAQLTCVLEGSLCVFVIQAAVHRADDALAAASGAQAKWQAKHAELLSVATTEQDRLQHELDNLSASLQAAEASSETTQRQVDVLSSELAAAQKQSGQLLADLCKQQQAVRDGLKRQQALQVRQW